LSSLLQIHEISFRHFGPTVSHSAYWLFGIPFWSFVLSSRYIIRVRIQWLDPILSISMVFSIFIFVDFIHSFSRLISDCHSDIWRLRGKYLDFGLRSARVWQCSGGCEWKWFEFGAQRHGGDERWEVLSIWNWITS
jgi:hypothetical protein